MSRRYLIAVVFALVLALTLQLAPASAQGQTERYDWEWSSLDIVLDVASHQKAYETWTVTYKRNAQTGIAWPATQWTFWSSDAFLTVTRAWDSAGELKVEHLTGPPIPQTNVKPETPNVRIYLREPLQPKGSTTFSFQIERTHGAGYYEVQTFRTGFFVGTICREATLKIMAPDGYTLHSLWPDTATRSISGSRDCAEIKFTDVKEGNLRASIVKRDMATAASQKSVSECIYSSQIVDILSDKTARVTWTIKEGNSSSKDRRYTTVAMPSTAAMLTVRRVYDNLGDLEFQQEILPPASPGLQGDKIVRVRFRYPLSVMQVTEYTMEIDAVAERGFNSGYAVSSGDSVFQIVRLEIIAPRGYRISGTEPAEATKKLVQMRETAILDGQFAKDVTLTAHFSTVIPLLATVGLVVAGGAGTAIWFSVIVLLRRRRKLGAAETLQAYEKKLAQWEKEGYDVGKMREKLLNGRK